MSTNEDYNAVVATVWSLAPLKIIMLILQQFRV